MEFRPCIDIHNGQVKQIVGGSLSDHSDSASENFVATRDAAYYANHFRELGLRDGHVVMLNPASSSHYEATKAAALFALQAWPEGFMAGGGITPANAKEFLDAGASAVIVTSYVFRDGQIDNKRLDELLYAVGRGRLVLDLSCRKKDGRYFIVTDRWQKFTETEVTKETLEDLSNRCAEFLVHAADIEGRQAGIDEELISILASADAVPITYAGGVHTLADLTTIRRIGKDRLNVTVGSALDLFGGPLKLDDVLAACGPS